MIIKRKRCLICCKVINNFVTKIKNKFSSLLDYRLFLFYLIIIFNAVFKYRQLSTSASIIIKRFLIVKICNTIMSSVNSFQKNNFFTEEDNMHFTKMIDFIKVRSKFRILSNCIKERANYSSEVKSDRWINRFKFFTWPFSLTIPSNLTHSHFSRITKSLKYLTRMLVSEICVCEYFTQICKKRWFRFFFTFVEFLVPPKVTFSAKTSRDLLSMPVYF
jgi:hypothetical protein